MPLSANSRWDESSVTAFSGTGYGDEDDNKLKDVFSRDCLHVELLDPDKGEDIFIALFVCHLKSKYLPYHPMDEQEQYEVY